MYAFDILTTIIKNTKQNNKGKLIIKSGMKTAEQLVASIKS